MSDESFESNQTTEDILKKLQKYGDSLLDEDRHKEWKRKKGSKVTTNVHERTGTTEPNKRNKKKKKKIKELSTEPQSKQTTDKINNQDELLGKISNKNKKRCGENRHLHAMQEELRLNMAPATQRENLLNNGQPAAQAPLSKPGDQPTSSAAVVVFNDPAKRKQQKNQLKRVTEDGADDDSHPTFELKKARLDVKWLGISGMNKESHLEARRKDLIGRGAKPPKRAYMNYRELQEKRKVELSQVKEKRELDRRSGFNVGKSKDRNRRDRGEEYLDGQVGRFKDGVLYLDKDAKQRLQKSGPRGRNKNR